MVRRKTDVPKRISIMIPADLLSTVDNWKNEIEDVSRSELISKLVRYALEQDAVDNIFPDQSPQLAHKDHSLSHYRFEPRKPMNALSGQGPPDTEPELEDTPSQEIEPVKKDKKWALEPTLQPNSFRAREQQNETASPKEVPLMVARGMGGSTTTVEKPPVNDESGWPTSSNRSVLKEQLRHGDGEQVQNPEELQARMQRLKHRVQNI